MKKVIPGTFERLVNITIVHTFSQKDIDAPDLSKIGCFTSIT